MCDDNHLGHKVKILTQLLNRNTQDQCELLVTLARLLEEKDNSWNILAARRTILTYLDTHHPHVNISKASEKWRQDHKAENDKSRGGERDKAPAIPYYS